ncbi:MAG: phosphoribosylglycinamide formyltransferase [Thermoguttaceae bacterium]
MPLSPKIKIAVFISGTGRTLHNLLQRIHDGSLSAEIAVVIASSPNAKGLQYAERENIPLTIIEKKDYPDSVSYSEAHFAVCRQYQVDYVVLGGFIKLLRIPVDFFNRVLNIHPSLIPAFSGKGFYGSRVHEAALKFGVKVSGCTVHFVDNEYDHGPVILQKVVDVLENDTPDSLNDRVFGAECDAFPQALQLLAEGRVSVQGRRILIR